MTGASAMVSDSNDLKRLLRRMAGKDEGAFEELYNATKRKIFSTVLLIVKRRHLAEEVTQEAYVRIWLNAALYKPSLASPMVWMISIARNLAIDLVRKRVREVQSVDSFLFEVPDEGPTALETIEISEDQTDAMMRQLNVLFALQTLDPTRRHLLIAAYIRGESRKQLSERYGVPVNTIKTWIRRALLETRASLRSTVVAVPS
jgi:RNA polymerase sigma-70 factor (ECF subfamily)